jgi:acyl-CoA thioesterase II
VGPTHQRDLAGLFDLEPRGRGRWRGHSDAATLPWVYGGQLLGQSLVAAAREARAGSAGDVHSLHTTFLRTGAVGVPVDYEVTELTSGRSRTVVQVDAWQGDRRLCRSLVSTSRDDAGMAHARPAPDVPTPEDATPLADVVVPGHGFWEGFEAIEVRLVPTAPEPPAHAAWPASHAWVRTADPLPDDPVLHQAALAYASDLLLGTAIGTEDPTTPVPAYWRSSLDHTLWLTTPTRADRWLLLEHVSPQAFAGRTLFHVAAFTEHGQAVATASQEARTTPAPTAHL